MPNPDHSLGENLKSGPSDNARVATGFRRLLPIFARHTANGWQIRVMWGRLAALSAVLFVVGWIGSATVAYFFVKYQRGFDDVRFADILLLPVRWEEYQKARGDFYIKLAQKQLEESQYREAFYSLRIGVSKSPSNRDGRLLLAQFYAAWKRTDLAQKTLLEGLPSQQADVAYLKPLFSYLLLQQADETTIEVTTKLLSADTSLSDRNRLIALAGASAHFFRGNYDRAEDLVRAYKLNESRDGRLLDARMEWERGYQDLALLRLRALREEFPADDEIYTQTISFLRDNGREGDARQESLLQQIANPANAKPQIDLLYAYAKSGDQRSLSIGVESIFKEFGRDQNALLALADFAANSGNPILARRIYDHCKSNAYSWEGAALMTVEANIVAKDYQSALETARSLLKENPDWAKRYYSVFNGLQAIALYGLGDAEAAQLFLTNFLGQTSVRADNLVAVSSRLLSVGARAQARQVLAQAVTTDPLNQAALTSLLKLDLEMNETAAAPANLRRLLTMRKPSQDVLRVAYRKLGSDLYLLSKDRGPLLDELSSAMGPKTARISPPARN